MPITYGGSGVFCIYFSWKLLSSNGVKIGGKWSKWQSVTFELMIAVFRNEHYWRLSKNAWKFLHSLFFNALCSFQNIKAQKWSFFMLRELITTVRQTHMTMTSEFYVVSSKYRSLSHISPSMMFFTSEKECISSLWVWGLCAFLLLFRFLTYLIDRWLTQTFNNFEKFYQSSVVALQ